MSRELAARLADLCGAKTKALNQAIKRNLDRFPGDFIFDLSREEILRMSQSVISLQKLRFSKRVRAFTEHGAVMAAMVLSSPRAVVMSVYVVRAFIKMREDFAAKILEEPAEILTLICSRPDTPRHRNLEDKTLRDIRKTVEAHLKNTYLKRVQAPQGVKAALKCWMELS